MIEQGSQFELAPGERDIREILKDPEVKKMGLPQNQLCMALHLAVALGEDAQAKKGEGVFGIIKLIPYSPISVYIYPNRATYKVFYHYPQGPGVEAVGL